MLKKLAWFLLAGFIFIIIFLTYRFLKNPASVRPQYYKASALASLSIEAPVAFVGADFAHTLGNYQELLSEKISRKLNDPIKIQNFSVPRSNLARTLAQLKKSQRWPRLMIYTGSNSESWESRYIWPEYRSLKINLRRHESDFWQSLILFVPQIARFLYVPIEKKIFSKSPNKDKKAYQQSELLKRNILLFKLYELELTELIELSKIRGSELILITTPVNLLRSPDHNCQSPNIPGAPSSQIIDELISSQEFKEAFELAKTRSKLLITDPYSFYQLGVIAQAMGNKKTALRALRQANAYDCNLKGSNVVFNEIMRRTALRHQIPLLDIQQYLYDQENWNTLFIDEDTPQALHMERLTTFLAKKIKIMLNI